MRGRLRPPPHSVSSGMSLLPATHVSATAPAIPAPRTCFPRRAYMSGTLPTTPPTIGTLTQARPA